MTNLIDDIRRDREAGTPGDWIALNMTHEEGRPMTHEELGEYVKNSLNMGVPDKFLFVSGEGDNGSVDVCHVGNGPKGGWNARRIARVPQLEAAYIEQAAEIERLREALEPSGSTKYAYSGEFEFTQVGFDEDGDEVHQGVTVPWTTIKDIMAAISARAEAKS